MSSRLIAELALLGTLALHGIILAAFHVSGSSREPLEGKESSRTIFLSPKDSATPWELRLWSWSELNDPTIMALPDEQKGFSYVRALPREAPYTPAPEYRITVTPSAEHAPRPVNLVSPLPPHYKEIAALWSATPRIPAPSLPAPPSFNARIIWRTQAGIPVFPEPVLSFSKRKLQRMIQYNIPERPTRTAIIRQNGLTRVKLRQSCGNNTLDILAVEAIRRMVSPLPGTLPLPVVADAAERHPIVPEKGQAVVIETEWRLLIKRKNEAREA